MKYLLITISLLSVCMTDQGWCSSSAHLPLAVINKARIKSEAKAFQSVHTQIDRLRETFYQEILRLETELRQQAAALQKLEVSREENPRKISAAKLLKKKQERDQRKNALEKLVQSRKQQLDALFQHAYAKIDAAFKEIVAEITKERSLILILNAESVVNENAPDITDEIIRRLDVLLPEVQLTST